MTLFSMTERELRRAARAPRTYRTRLLAGLAGVAVFSWMFFVMAWAGMLTGRAGFNVLVWLAFLFCLFSGVFLTSDALSSEKRENTLGLLFLTRLRGWEIALGKFMAAAVSSAFVVGALIPVLALPIMMGGLTGGDLGRVLLSLGNTLFFSLALGLFVSAAGRQSLKTMSGALLLLALFVVGPYLARTLIIMFMFAFSSADAIASAPNPTRMIEGFASVSPFHMQRLSLRPGPTEFWRSLLTVHALGWLFLGLACWTTQRCAREKVAGPKAVSWRERWGRVKAGSPRVRERFRKRWLDRNPVYWIRMREGGLGLAMFRMFFLTGGVVLLGLAALAIDHTGEVLPSILIYSMAGILALHLALMFRIAALAGHRLGEDRESGALELLLASPVPLWKIVWGHWRGVMRQMLVPIIVLLGLQLLWLAGFLVAVDGEVNDPAGISGFVKSAFTTAWWFEPHTARTGWMVLFFVIMACFLLFALHWITLGWLGMWLGIRGKSWRLAPWLALGLVLIVPWPIAVLLLIALMPLLGLVLSEHYAILILPGLILALPVLNDLLLLGWSWFRLRNSFRAVTTDRDSWFLGGWRWHLKRAGIGAAAAAALILLFYGQENWRGKRAWAALEAELAEQGQVLDSALLRPEPVPDHENFAKTPLLAPLADWDGWPAWGAGTALDPVLSINLLGTVRWRGTHEENTPDWTQLRRVNLAHWQKQFRDGAAGFPLPDEPQSPSDDVLLALSRFETELEEIQRAGSRPRAQFAVPPQNLQMQYFQLQPHLTVLQNLAEVLSLRAAALLAGGESDRALEDVRLMFYLASTVSEEANFLAQVVRAAIYLNALQPVWEGLAGETWSAAELEEIETLCAEPGLLADFERAAWGDTLLKMDFWKMLRDPAMLDHSLGGGERFQLRYASLIFPKGRTYQKQLQHYRFYRDQIVPAVDSVRQRVDVDQCESWSRSAAFFGGMYASMATHVVDKATRAAAQAQTSLHLARIACALERQRLDHGAIPDELNRLVPDYVAELPHDLITGEPLRYRVLSDGRFLLYSVGWNQEDNGGSPWDDWVWGAPQSETAGGTED